MIGALAAAVLAATQLPSGTQPDPVPCPHFPDRLHAFVWRNWQLVPVERIARVIGATPKEVLRLGDAMGLSGPPRITPDQQRRSYITVIRRNWHLLPYEQLLDLLGWTEEQLAYTLREDDALFIKLGNLKPRCELLRYAPPDEAAAARAQEIASVVREAFPEGVGVTEEPLFGFVKKLSAPPRNPEPDKGVSTENVFTPRYCYSYFALYGDPLLDEDLDPYPDGYLARMAAVGVDGVWLQAVLYKLAPFPWDEEVSEAYEKRIENLRLLVARARKHGVGVYLYLNEPRAMPLAFYARRPDLKGVVEGDHAALCTSAPEVQQYLTGAVASVCAGVPDLAGFFTITASENLTNCWSHGQGKQCSRCAQRPPAEVVAEVNALVAAGIQRAGTPTRLIAWDWGWGDDWAEAAIAALPQDVSFMSVSEWSIPICRGGVDSIVGEYSISTVGPGPRATRHWAAARRRSLRTLAKVQISNTWELSAVPYIPAVENVARHAANLREAGVDGLMLGWTLGGYPSPNLEVVAEMGRMEPPISVERAMETVARARFGDRLALHVVQGWKRFSAAFSEFPFHIGMVYTAPLQTGPSNLLWGEPTGYRATMVGFPYDDLNAWRAVYPADVFVAQFTRIADGFDSALASLKSCLHQRDDEVSRREAQALTEEVRVAEAAAIHFRSVANQARFVTARNALAGAENAVAACPHLDMLETVLRDEMALARRLYAIQTRDSRTGFEASNHYFYIPMDLAEKVINCYDLLNRWLPAQRARFNPASGNAGA